MKNVLLDINVVLDVLLQREPWFADSRAVWQACDEGRINGHVAAVSLTNIWYITRRSGGGVEKARQSVEACLRAFHIASTYRETLEAALKMSGGDFEDNVQIASAKTSLLDAIITRDAEGYRESPIPVLAPAALLVRLQHQQ
jgi:predicted nucleic acid-binding protein